MLQSLPCWHSYISASASSAGAAAEMAASRKQAKCAALSGSYVFQPIALETLGPINESAVQFLNDLGHRINSVTTDYKEAHYLSLSDSIALQRFNVILLHESFGSDVDPDLQPTSFFLTYLAFNHRDLYYRGYKNNNIRIYIAPYGRNFRAAGDRSDQCSVKA